MRSELTIIWTNYMLILVTIKPLNNENNYTIQLTVSVLFRIAEEG